MQASARAIANGLDLGFGVHCRRIATLSRELFTHWSFGQLSRTLGAPRAGVRSGICSDCYRDEREEAEMGY